MEEQLEHAGQWLLPGEYSLADIMWFSMMPAPKVVPELCTEDASPRTMRWLERKNARPGVQALGGYRPQS